MTGPFLDALAREGYLPTTIADTVIAEDQRVPAWLVEGVVARFGYVFWERFTPQRARKIWGSVHKNAKGDWDRVLGKGSRQTIYANPGRREHIDSTNPSGW